MNNKFSKLLLESTILVGLASVAMATPAFAQSSDDSSDEVVVTGSRIVKRDFVTNSPVVTIGQEQFNLTGTVNTESLLNTLPQVVPGLDRTSNNPGGGFATIDLRGLGSQRTLVLVDGQRIVPTTGGGTVDINNIPTALIEDVEVVTGGASAVYGSDAVAGVVNFILKDDFEGVEASTSYELTERGDAGIFSADLTIGGNFDGDRGNAVFSVGYTDRNALFQDDREFSTFAQFDDGAGNLFDGGSSGVPEGRIGGVFDGAAGIFETDGTIRPFVGAGDNNDFFNFAPDNFLQLPQERIQFSGQAHYDVNDRLTVKASGLFANNSVPQQLAPTPIFEPRPPVPFELISLDGNPFIAPTAQVTISGNNIDTVGVGTRADRMFNGFNDDGTPATGFLFADDDEDELNPLNMCVNCVFDAAGNGFNDTAPLIDTDGDGIADTFSQGAFDVRRRLVEVGPRIADNEFSTFQIAFGLDFELSDTWSFDLNVSEGRTRGTEAQSGNVNVDRFFQSLLLADEVGALDADGNDIPDGNVDLDANGNPSCSVTDPNGGLTECVPLNIFGLGNISQEAADFISTLVVNSTNYTQTNITANFVGDTSGLFELPGGPIGLAFGGEYRDESFVFSPSQDVAASTIAGFNGSPAVSGEFDVVGVYGEAYLPFLRDAPFAEILALEVAGRYEDYSTAGNVESYKVAGEWAPVSDIRFRGSFNTAVRAPSITELFAPQGENFPGAADPCASSFSGDANIQSICTSQGVPAGNLGSGTIDLPSGQVREISGGNPNLFEETAETLTLGVVLEPSFIPNLTLAVDYFDITIDDVISDFGGGANNVITTCFNDTELGGVGSPFCDAIERGQSGLITAVSVTSQNVASLDLTGFDILANYSHEIDGLGNFGLNYVGTITDTNTLVPFEGGTPITCAGEFGVDCGEPQPTYKHRTTLSWAKGAFKGQVLWRYVGGSDDDEGLPFPVAVTELDAENYFDLSGSWDMSDNFSLTAGVDNVLDTDPPILGDNQEQANTFPATYDVFGRTYFLKGTARF